MKRDMNLFLVERQGVYHQGTMLITESFKLARKVAEELIHMEKDDYHQMLVTTMPMNMTNHEGYTINLLRFSRKDNREQWNHDGRPQPGDEGEHWTGGYKMPHAITCEDRRKTGGHDGRRKHTRKLWPCAEGNQPLGRREGDGQT